MNRLPTLSSLLLLGLLAACQAGAPDRADAAASEKPDASARAAAAAAAREAAWAPPSPVPSELTGALTVERIAGARALLPAPRSEPKAYPLLLSQLGKPTKVLTGTHALVGKEQKRFQWAAKSGTTCASFFVVEQPNTMSDWPAFIAEDTGGGTFEMPKTLPTNDADGAALRAPWEDYARCVAVLGEPLGLPADLPGATGPGAVVTKADILAGLKRAPSKWLDKTVVVAGKVSGSGERFDVATTKGDVECRARAGGEAPKADEAKKRVRGRVADLRKSDMYGLDLVDCELAP